jgi:hypothetical protein
MLNYSLKLTAVMLAVAFSMQETPVAGDTQEQITWKFTVRDFLPAACYHSYEELAALWNYTQLADVLEYPNDSPPPVYPPSTDTTTTNRYRGNETLFCPIWNDIADGKYDGHPDFEISTRMYPFVFGEPKGGGCSGFDDFLTSPANNGESCVGTDGGNITKIIDAYLEFDESGIPKPVYCTSPPYLQYGEKRCGWLLGPGSKKAMTSGPVHFRTWYRDSEKYNLRVGFSLDLTSSNNGTYSFASGNNGFHPLQQYANVKPCLSTNLRLDCSNGGKIFPLSNLALANEITLNKSFGFTVESHFFFDFKGDEKFSFTGGTLHLIYD